MRKLVYHVGMTVDHYIADEEGSTAQGFLHEGDHVTDYLEELKTYDTVVMGRATYEYGYQYGLQPGQRAYPWMKHYIFSKTLRFDLPPGGSPEDPPVQVVSDNAAAFVRQLKATEGPDIYLCGGGALAGFLLEHELLDRLKIKLYPALLGRGIPLLGDRRKRVNLTLADAKTYGNGVLLLTYDLQYP